jgi:hypothetical protein
MNLQTTLKKPLAALVSGALVLSSMLPALAAGNNGSISSGDKTYTYTAPTQAMEMNDNIITATAHRAASPILGMMGVNATAGFGMINGSAPSTLTDAEGCAALGIWGTSMNESPDPYYWNYFYNFYASENGLEIASDALVNDNVAASPAQADGTLKEEYGNVSVSLSTRPDIVVGCATKGGAADDVSGYDAQLATIHSFTADSEFYQEGDETYSPKLVSYQMTYIKDMIATVYRLADAITEVEKDTGKTTRYGDVQTIAGDYEKYVYGVIAYVQEELASKGLEEKTVAVITALNEDGTYSIADAASMSATSSNRPYEYAMCVSKNLADEVGSTIVTLDQLLSADAIVCINNNSVSQSTLEASFGDKSFDGTLVCSIPNTLYGMTMNSVENAMGYAYVIGSLYCDELNIDPVELCAYFYQHFWHVTDLSSLATVVKTNFADTVLPAGINGTLSSNYSAATVEAKLATGISYFAANQEKFNTTEYQLIGMNAWNPDTTTGIGSNLTNSFSDVPAGIWYDTYVSWATSAGIVEGTGNNKFSPNVTLNRAMFVTILWRAAGSPEPTTTENPFTDVQNTDSTSWYYKAVLWAVENGITEGTSATTFSPNASCKRSQVVTFLWRYENQPQAKSDNNPFTDVQNTANTSWYYTAVLWAVENGVTDGMTATTFAPNDICNRAQAVGFLYKLLV